MSKFNESNIVKITEKLSEISANVGKVFKSGTVQGHREGYIDGLSAGGHLDGYKAGKQEVYDALWDAIQSKGQRTDYRNGFAFWNAETFHPKYKVVPTESAGNIFYSFGGLKRLESEYVDLSHIPRGTNFDSSMSYAFYNCDALEEIEDIGIMPSFSYEGAFANCFALRKIAKITVDAGTLFPGAFVGCKALEDVIFEGEIGQDVDFTDCTKLKWGSISNIVSHLSDSAAGKTLTFSSKAIEEMGTDTQSWIEFTWMKPNWTITLA